MAKLIETEVFGTVLVPSSFSEILGLKNESRNEAVVDAVYMWRGQSDISWPLHSGAFRKLLKRPNFFCVKDRPTEEAVQFYEKSLLKLATHRGFRRVNNRELSDLELLARLQHHGAATRLLDATRNLLVALYFAVRENPDKNGMLFGWHSDFLGGYEGEITEESYDEAFGDLGDYNHPITFEPTEVSPRIASQHSQFLYSKISDGNYGSVCVDPDKGASIAIAISPKVKKEALKLLVNLFNIRHYTLFPDFDGFSSANSIFSPEDMRRW